MTTKSKGITLSVEIDDNPINPREDYEHFGKMICWHRRYDLGDKNPYKKSQDFWDDKELQDNIFVKLNVYMMDHSGLSFSANPFTTDPQNWDSGQIGIIYATEADTIKEFGDLSEDSRLEAEKLLASEIAEYNDYHTSNYYRFSIEGLEGEVVDSCGGFRGDTMQEVLESMQVVADRGYDFLFEKILEKQQGAEMY